MVTGSGMAQHIAHLITEYLGPGVPRQIAPSPPGSATATAATVAASAPGTANLTALRSLLDHDPATYNSSPNLLTWKLREALRTEFFKIRYPHPPSPRLLHLVTTSEIAFTNFGSSPRPFYFPGARVAVPTETGTHRAGTSLQLRFNQVEGATVPEALLHLDGPNGGSFQWVQTQVLSSLAQYVPIRTPASQPMQPGRATPSSRGGRPTGSRGKKPGQQGSGSVRGRGRPRKQEVRAAAPRVPESTLPADFLPDALRSTSPPPRKRLRHDVSTPLSLSSGSIRRTLDCWHEAADTVENSIVPTVQNQILANTLAIERLLGRRNNISLGGVVEYYVKWSGAPMAACSWEARDSLMIDVPGLVLDFDMRHPQEAVACSTVPDDDAAKEAAMPFHEVDCNKGAGSERPGDAKQIFDSATKIPIPKYVDTSLLSLNFCGMEYQLRLDNKCSLFINTDEVVADRKHRLACFAKENPEASAKIFGANSGEILKESAMAVVPKPRVSIEQLWITFQKSLEAHKDANRRPILFPRGLGQVLPRSVVAPIPVEDIANAPASWESYFMSLGMQCKDWEREFIPDMPGTSEKVKDFVETAAKEIRKAQLTSGRERGTRFDAGRVIGTQRPSTRNNVAGNQLEEGSGSKSQSEAGGKVQQQKSVNLVNGVKGENEVGQNTVGDLLRDKDSEFKRALAEAMEETKTAQETSEDGKIRTERIYDVVWGCWKDVLAE